MNLGKLEDGVSTKEQLLEVLGDNNNKEEDAEEEEDIEKTEPTLVEGSVTLDWADNNDNADNAMLNITLSCDLCDKCQTLEELHRNSHLVGEAYSCSPCKRQFNCADDLMDHTKWYHKTGAECVKHGVKCALCNALMHKCEFKCKCTG